MRLVPAVLAAAILSGNAASPDWTFLQPRGGQCSTTTAVTLTGNRLDDAEEIISYSTQIKVLDLKVISGSELRANFQIDPDCPPGEHLFRVRTRSGISYARSFWTGPWPALEEVEPNNQFEGATPASPGHTLTGIVKNEDVDYFKIEAKKGQRLSVEVEGIRLGTSFWDPYLAILDSKKFELAVCDDSPLLIQDPYASVIIPEDGTYYIEIRDTSYAGNDRAPYRMHVGDFPRPATIYPPGGPPGNAMDLTFLGDAGGPISQTVTLPAAGPETVPLFASLHGVRSPSPNPFRLSSLPNLLEQGANASPEEAKANQPAVPAPVACNGIIGSPGDQDCFRFSAKKDQKFDLQVFARSLRSPLDATVEVLKADGGVLARNDDNGPQPDSRISGLTIPEDGDYFVRIRDQLARGAPTFVYRIELAPPAQALKGYITRADRIDSQMKQFIPVARGARYAALVNVDRTNCGGPVLWEAGDLPAGVTLDARPLPDGVTQQALLFTAAPDAPRSASLARLTLKSGLPDQTIPGRFVQKLEFVQGEPNQTPYVTSSQETLPIAVTEEVPFSLEIIPPPVPLVQSGTMDLKIKATRAPDFKAPITVRMIWNPPGVTSPGTVEIPEGQTETTYQLTAKGDAPLKTWPLTVLGEAGVNGGTLCNAAPFTDVTVAAPWLTMKMEMGAAEQGKPGGIFCSLEITKPFSGRARVTLYGLPAKVTTIEQEILATDKEVRFPITTLTDSPAGKHQNLFCQALIPENGTTIPHTIGQGGIFRVDPPPPAPAPAAPVPVAVKTEAPAAAAKPLSRLEQLRQQQAPATP